MNLTRDRLSSIGWVSILVFVGALTAALMFRVNAVRSEVQLAERQIVALRHEKEFLETEFETRANQQQLSDLNEFDFGYKAPAAGQYLESERQLASLGLAPARDAPSPILMARADATTATEMVSPLTGKLIGSAVAAEPVDDAGGEDVVGKAIDAANLGDRLSHIRRRAGDRAADDTGPSEPARRRPAVAENRE